MKRLVLGDLHFGVRNKQFSNEQFLYIEKIIIPFIKTNNIEEIIITGDLLHHRNATSNWLLTELKQRFFEPLENMGVIIHLIFGNHDAYLKNSLKYSPLYVFESEYVKLYNKTTKIENMLFVPYGCSFDNFEAEYCFGHFDVIGGLMPNGLESKFGYKPEDFKKFKKVITGHYHRKSQILNITYVGSPMQLSFGEFDIDMFVHTFDNESGETENIFNTFSPRFIKVSYGVKTDDREFNIRIDGLTEEQEFYPTEAKAIQAIGDNYVELIIRKIPSKTRFINFKNLLTNITGEVNLEVIQDLIKSDMDEIKVKDISSFLFEYFKSLVVLPYNWESTKLLEVFLSYYMQQEKEMIKGSSSYKSINFNWITIKNFGAFGNETIKVEFKSGCYRIIGENGAGKTTISEALGYLLTGKSIFGKSVGELVNTINNKQMVVEGEMLVGNNLLRLKRGRKPDIFDIIVDGELEPHLPESKEYQLILDNFIGLSIDHIKFLILKNKEVYTPFSEMKPQSKRDFIDTVFNFEIFSKILEQIKLDLKEQHKLEIDQELDLKVLETKLNSEKKHLDEIIKLKEDLIQTEIDKLNDTINVEESSIIKKLKSDIVYTVNRLYELNLELNDIKVSLKSNINNLNDVFTEFKTKLLLSIGLNNEAVKTLKNSIMSDEDILKKITFSKNKFITDLDTNLELDLNIINDEIKTSENYIKKEKEDIINTNNLIKTSESLTRSLIDLIPEKIAIAENEIKKMNANLIIIESVQSEYNINMVNWNNTTNQKNVLLLDVDRIKNEKKDVNIKIGKMVNLCGDCPIIQNLKAEMSSKDYDSLINSKLSQIKTLDDEINNIEEAQNERMKKLNKKSKVINVKNTNIKLLEELRTEKLKLENKQIITVKNYNEKIQSSTNNINNLNHNIESNKVKIITLNSTYKTALISVDDRATIYHNSLISKRVEIQNKLLLEEAKITKSNELLENKNNQLKLDIKMLNNNFEKESSSLSIRMGDLTSSKILLNIELVNELTLEETRVNKVKEEIDVKNNEKDQVKFNIDRSKVKDLDDRLKHDQMIFDIAHHKTVGLEFLKGVLLSKDGIKNFIIGEYINYFNKIFNQHLSKFSVSFAGLFNNEFDIEILGSLYKNLSYKALSSGEKKVIDFSFLVSISELQETLFQKSINVLVLDEILSGLDINNKMVAFNSIIESSSAKTILFVEHDLIDNNGVNAVWKVTNDRTTGSKIDFDWSE